MKNTIYPSLLALLIVTACNNPTQPASISSNNAIGSTNQADTATNVQKSLAEAKQKIEGYRQQVLNKELTMGEAAEMYSDDPGSNKQGGRYINIARGQFVPEFEKVAFALQPGQISEVFQTQYGFHFVQLISRHNDLIDVSHVLVMPK